MGSGFRTECYATASPLNYLMVGLVVPFYLWRVEVSYFNNLQALHLFWCLLASHPVMCRWESSLQGVLMVLTLTPLCCIIIKLALSINKSNPRTTSTTKVNLRSTAIQMQNQLNRKINLFQFSINDRSLLGFQSIPVGKHTAPRRTQQARATS